MVSLMASLRISDPKQAYYAHEAREFLRKRLIGKHVKVQIDFIRPRDGEYEERECATVRYGGQNSYVLRRFPSRWKEKINCDIYSMVQKHC